MKTFSRRDFLKTSAAVAAGEYVLSNRTLELRMGAKRPNIILIFSDDQGYGDLSCYPHTLPIQTPNIDRLASEGLRLTDAHVSAPICSPSRAGLLTGRYQQRFGYYGNGDAEPGIPTSQRLLGHYLKPAGYTTACIGKWHLGWEEKNHPLNMGFDEFFGFLGGQHDYFDPNIGHPGVGQDPNGYAPIYDGTELVEQIEYTTIDFTRRALDFINRHAHHPFCLYLAYNAIHGPLQAPQEYLARYNNGATNRDKVRAMLDVMDEGVGQLLDTLKNNGIDDNTMVFFISDNGGSLSTGHHNWKLREGKGRLFEGGIRIPFIVRWPKGLPKNKTYSAPVITLDVLPTILAAVGLQPPDDPALDGVNLLPYFQGKISEPPHELLYWSFAEKTNRWAIRRGDWKLVHEKSDFGLYNLKNDLQEQNNLIEDQPQITEELTALYESWIQQMPPRIGG